jgi:PIN domain nuclease of toxin-antitoxin system
VRLLLDTHAFLWYVLDDPQLSPAAKLAIELPGAQVFVSPASYWETAIKISIGKYSLTVPFETFWQRAITDNSFEVLAILVAHAAVLSSLPFHHRDPFDRLIVAQAVAGDLAVVSADAVLDKYPIRRIW